MPKAPATPRPVARLQRHLADMIAENPDDGREDDLDKLQGELFRLSPPAFLTRSVK